jgi:hypothetical protein
VNGRNGEGDHYHTDGEIHLAVLSPGGEAVTAPPKKLHSSPLVEMKNGGWKTVAGWLGN